MEKDFANEYERVISLMYKRTAKHMRFTAGTALNNVPSVRLLRSLGFMKAGEEQVSFYKDSEGKDIYFTGGIFALDIPAWSGGVK